MCSPALIASEHINSLLSASRYDPVLRTCLLLKPTDQVMSAVLIWTQDARSSCASKGSGDLHCSDLGAVAPEGTHPATPALVLCHAEQHL